MTRAIMQQALDALDHVQWKNWRTDKAIQALRTELAKPEPEPCSKCHGIGYYDEGHENDDGSMGGGNYVECDKRKPRLIGWATKAQLKNGAFLVGSHRGNDCLGLFPVYTKEQL